MRYTTAAVLDRMRSVPSTVANLLETLQRCEQRGSNQSSFGDLCARVKDGTLADVTVAYTRAGQLPQSGDALDASDRDTLAPLMPGCDLEAWTRSDLRRLTLLLTRADAARACFEAGDADEQTSWLRAVSVLPEPAQFLPLVIDACRTNILPVFRAVANGNPYPAAHFPERNFNQLVLKSLFNGVPLARIVGLAKRRNPELARMAGDYAAERRAAGRSVPDDIGLAL